jgi:hypothetical protein
MKTILLLLLVCIPIILVGQVGDVGITFNFANGELTSESGVNYYEFDVMANASESGTKLGTGMVYFSYNTVAFGDWIYYHNKVTVTKGTLITTSPIPLYNLIVNDTYENVMGITFELGTDNYGNALPTNPTLLVHVKLEISVATEMCNIAFGEDLMYEQQYYDDNAIWYDPITYGINTLNDPLIAAPVASAATAICHNGFTARWEAVAGATSYRLDVSTATDNFSSFVSGYEDKTVSLNLARVETVGINTAYKYRVRAYNGISSLNSNVIDVTTTNTIDGTSANTSIAGAAVTIDVPNVTDDPPFTDNDVIINPTTTSSNDFSIVLSWHPTGYEDMPNARLVCTVNSSDNSALNGDYTINHVGMGFDPAAAKFKWGGIWQAIAFTTLDNSTSFTISDLSKGSKGELIVAFDNGSGTLPVELSSFTAVINFQNNITLQWITQSETNLSGFRIYRGLDDSLENAELLDVFIPGTNTSQLQSYVFCDTEAIEEGMYYYWLENLDLDGSNTLHGPVSITVNTNHQGTPEIPLFTQLQSVFPNPFNPTTSIAYSLAKAEEVSFAIYNARGQLVRNLQGGFQTKGNYQIRWNGKDNHNQACCSGVYYVKMSAGKDTFIRKLVLLK